MPVDSVFFWTDSTTVLSYINNEAKRYHTFVANRVAVIRDSTDVSQWKYVNTELNPADVCSRGQGVKKFVTNTSWLNGPEFLNGPETEWPKKPKVNLDPRDPEVKKSVVVNAIVVDEGVAAIDKLFRRYSDWYSLRKAVAWLLRLKKILRLRVAQRREGSVMNTEQHDLMTLKDMQESEQAILAYVQHSHFSEEISTLIKGSPIKKSSPIYKLDPKMQNNVLRVGGRLSEAAISEDAKYPVVLPKDSYVSELILQHFHHSSGHSGRNHMLSNLHQHYWIVGANSAARKIINRCVTCRRLRAKVQSQKMANLPADRLKPNEPPFTRVGMDYFGPVEVKQGRSRVKRYGVVFTCLAVRAVHIEVACSLDTDSCISAIRRFIARRGQVSVIRSDNGTNIVGARKELKKEINNWNQEKISSALLQKNIEWKFNPPGGSHFGGIWERQIRTIRSLMCALLKEQMLTDESLQTLFCEIEAIINSRPLTRISADVHDLEPLTPNHLLLMKNHQNLSPVSLEFTGACIRRRWKQVQYLANIFWRRWLKEYLVQLQERQKWVHPQTNIKVDDIVLIANEAAPRNLWQMARVLETLPDKHGHVRQARLRTQTNVLLRPVHKLILLLESEIDSTQMNKKNQTNQTRTRNVKPRERLDL